MKTLFKSILIILGLITYSCNNKEQDKILKTTLNNYDTLKPPPMPEYLKDKKKYVLPNVTVVDLTDIKPLFLELLKGKKILKTENFIKNKYFINGFARNVYNLYYKKCVPQKAGEYKNEGNFIIYDFIYADDNQYKIACDNLKTELQKLNINNNYEYSDYFDIIGDCVYFFDNRNKKVTIFNTDKINDYNVLKTFANNNKNNFDEIISVYPTGMEIIK